MTVKDIRECIMFARKGGLTGAREAFESVLAKALIEEKSGKYQGELPEEVVTNLIRKEIKELQETASYFTDHSDDRYGHILHKIALLQEYLPKQMSEEQVVEIIKEVIAAGETNKGKVIGAVCKKVSCNFDKAKVATLVDKVFN